MADDKVTFIKRKGGTVLLLKGRQYYKQREYKSGHVIWNCIKSKKEKCRGSVTLKGTIIIKEKEHSCQIAYIKNQIDEAINEMKKQASSSDVPIPQIYKKEKKKLLEQGIHLCGVQIPSLKSVQTGLYIAGRKRTYFKNVESVTIPDQLSRYLFADYQHKSCRIIVFCSEKGRADLVKADELFVDGTFESCPRPFYQLFTIHGDMGASSLETKVEPLLYALISDKKQESYVALFAMIKSLLPNWTPKKVHLDFETAIANALVSIYPEVQLKKCFYHFSKAIWIKATKELKIKRKIDRRIVGLCTALALLPENQIEEGIDYIRTESTCTPKITTFLKYMKTTWWKSKEYISTWCVYGERHRTNNVIESWHSRLNRNMKKRSPASILRLINVLMEMEDEMTSSDDVLCRRKENIDHDDFIMKSQLELLHNYITVGHFLDKLR